VRGDPDMIFRAAIRQSEDTDPYERYHTTQNNCVLKLFAILDSICPAPWYRRPLLSVTNQTLFMPTRAEHHLRYRGLLSDSALQNLEVELGW
jgi:hypothetical protein